MGWHDLEKEAMFRYEGQRNGWVVGPITQTQLADMSAREYEFHQILNGRNLQLAIEGRDADSLRRKFEAGLLFAHRYVKVVQPNGTAYAEVFTSSDYPHLGFIVRCSDGNYYKPETQWKTFEYVSELPVSDAPKTLQQAKEQHTQEGIAAANERDERRRGMQAGIEVTATPLGAMADKAKREWAASKTAK